ncbi:MAG: hypothetical protein AAF280_05390 [Pseudomonadota bacterium]
MQVLRRVRVSLLPLVWQAPRPRPTRVQALQQARVHARHEVPAPGWPVQAQRQVQTVLVLGPWHAAR